HNRKELLGPTGAVMTPHQYTAHDAELPLNLQQHGNRVHFRSVWIRRLRGYDQSAPAAAQPSAAPPGQPGRGRGGQPIVLGPDDIPIAPPAPEGFDKPRDGIARG